MGTAVRLGRICNLCGEQLTLSAESETGAYTDDLTALLETNDGDHVQIAVTCGCPQPRIAAFQGIARSSDY